MNKLTIAPSLLSANFSRMGDAIKILEAGELDYWVHLDVMDGQFVPNLTFGPKMIADLRPLTKKVFDVHLMVNTPENIAEEFIKAGADYVTFHAEATIHAHRLCQKIRALGAHPGVSIVPSTGLSAIEELLPFVDLVLIMTVNPGFGGQSLIPECLAKAKRLAALRAERGLNFKISIDGGINANTWQDCRASGADVFVIGSAYFNDPGPNAHMLSLVGNGKN